MNILLISDLHSSRRALVALDRLLSSKQFDLVLCPGDVTDRHDRSPLSYAEDFIDLVTVKHRTPLKCVFGNNDSREVIELLRQCGVLLHFDAEVIGGQRIAGIGDVDSQPDVPGGKPTDLTDTILVSHRPTPQFKTLKQQTRAFSNAPRIQIFGHLHNRAETWQLGRTLVMQVPAALNGRYAVLQLPEKQVEFTWFKDF